MFAEELKGWADFVIQYAREIKQVLGVKIGKIIRKAVKELQEASGEEWEHYQRLVWGKTATVIA